MLNTPIPKFIKWLLAALTAAAIGIGLPIAVSRFTPEPQTPPALCTPTIDEPVQFDPPPPPHPGAPSETGSGGTRALPEECK